MLPVPAEPAGHLRTAEVTRIGATRCSRKPNPETSFRSRGSAERIVHQLSIKLIHCRRISVVLGRRCRDPRRSLVALHLPLRWLVVVEVPDISYTSRDLRLSKGGGWQREQHDREGRPLEPDAKRFS